MFIRVCQSFPTKSLDKAYTNMITFAMLARQIILSEPSPTDLTPLLRYSCKLFLALSLEGFAPKKVNSFGIKQIQTLSAKHPGGGISASSTLQSFQCANLFPCHTYEKQGVSPRLRLTRIVFPIFSVSWCLCGQTF